MVSSLEHISSKIEKDKHSMICIAITPYSQLKKDTILIGVNCLADSNIQQLMDKELQIINPYRNHDDIAEASEYCWNLSLEYCNKLGILLNQIQGVSYSPSYWKTLLLPWLLAFIENLYDRYLRLTLIQKKFPDAVIEIPRTEISGPLYKKSINVWNKSHLHSININLYSLLIDFMVLDANVKYIDIVDIDRYESDNNSDKARQSNFTFFLKKGAKRLVRTVNIYTGMNLFESKGTDLKDDGFSKQALNREDIKFEHTNDEFKNVLQKFIQWTLPVSLFEEYRERNETAKNYLIKKNIKTVQISNTYWGNDSFKFLIAEVKEKGVKIIERQHGGGYGHYVIAATERVEREFADFFITWGWTDKRGCTAVALPDPRLSKLKNTHQEKNKNVLFIGSHGPMYMYRYQSYLMPEFVHLKYYPMKKAFLQQLKKPIQKNILYRPYLYEYGWQEKIRIQEILPDVRFDKAAEAVQSMKTCSLVVIDHPCTLFLESFVINVPTILFWDNSQCPMREEANPYFQLLIDAKILYYNPEDAAKKVNEIWEDVQGWWHKPEVQNAKDEFCRQFASTSKNWRKEWKAFLKTLN